MAAAVTRAEVDDIKRSLAEGKAENVIIRASLVKGDRDLAIVIQQIEGVPGIADDVKSLKSVIVDLRDMPREIVTVRADVKDLQLWKDGLPKTPREITSGRYRAVGMVASIIFGIAGLIFGIMGLATVQQHAQQQTTTTTTTVTPGK